MFTRDKIWKSLKYVMDNSKYVNINKKNIDNVLPFFRKKKEPRLNSDYLDIENFSQEPILIL